VTIKSKDAVANDSLRWVGWNECVCYVLCHGLPNDANSTKRSDIFFQHCARNHQSSLECLFGCASVPSTEACGSDWGPVPCCTRYTPTTMIETPMPYFMGSFSPNANDPITAYCGGDKQT